MLCRRLILAAVAAVAVAAPASAQQPTKQPVDGIKNFARVETTVACGGATSPQAVPEIRKMGFASIINLRLDSEPGADVAAEQAAAEAAGLRFFHVPFDGDSPDPAAVDRFIHVITMPGVEPAFIHCSGGNRAASMWLAKRLVVDRWDVARASAEAEGLGLTSDALKKFMIDYAATHKQ